MAEDPQRNFRSVYYEKVGFRGVEEKKSLEILLKDDRLDIEKLCTFSQRFPLPSMYRTLVWKVLLGILPPHHESHVFVMKYRKEQYGDVYRALQVIRFITDSTPQVEVFLRIYQLESGKLPQNPSFPLESEDEIFLAVAKAMEEMVEDNVDCYWLVSSFVNQLNNKYKESLPQLPKLLEQILSLEDSRLLAHLKLCSAMGQLPYNLWFRKCLAGCLPESSLQRQVSLPSTSPRLDKLCPCGLLQWSHESHGHNVLTVSNFQHAEKYVNCLAFLGIVSTLRCDFDPERNISILNINYRSKTKKIQFYDSVVEFSRVWDKVISGSCKILVFVAVEILLTFKMKLMALNSAEKIEQFLENIPQDNTDAIVSKAIELWHKHCGTPAHSV